MRIRLNGHGLGPYGAALPPDPELSLPAGATVKDVLDRLDLPPQLRNALLLFVNGRHCREDRVLAEGDALVFFPPAEGG